MCVCVCVCEREIVRERKRETERNKRELRFPHIQPTSSSARTEECKLVFYLFFIVLFILIEQSKEHNGRRFNEPIVLG